jgi:uncharacterized protein YbjT (DUF2867 family)
MSERILVTGATGTVGREVIKQLIEAGQEARALVRSARSSYRIQGPGVEIVEGDYSRPDTLEAAFHGVDKAFLATPVDRRMGRWYHAMSLAAKRAGTTHIIKLSAMGADHQSPSLLARRHAETDQLLENSGLKWTIIQPNSFYQNLLELEGSIRNENSFALPCGDIRQSHVDARDVAAVAMRALIGDGHEHHTYVLTGPEAITYSEMASIMSESLGRQIEYVEIPEDDLRDRAIKSGLPEWKADMKSGVCSLFASGGLSEVTDTIEEIVRRKPIDFRQFVKNYIESFR